MTQQINLLNLALLPKPVRLPAWQVGTALLLTSVLCAATAGWSMWQSAKARDLFAQRAAQHQNEVASLRAAVLATVQASGGNLSPAELQRQLTELKAQVFDRQTVLAQLTQGQLDERRRYSALLRVLAQRTPTDIWLTEVQAGEQITLAGRATQAPALRDWVSAVAATDYFAGRSLQNMVVERDSAAASTLRFRVGTRTDDAPVRPAQDGGGMQP